MTSLLYIDELEHAVTLSKEDIDMEADANVTAAFKATCKEAALLIFLSDGRVHSKESIFNALYFDPDDAPEMKIIDVFVCKVRKKLAGSGITVMTHWGIGFQMTGIETMKAVIAGQPIEWDENRRVKGKSNRPGDAGIAPYGAVRDTALRYLRDQADENGVVKTTSRALSIAVQMYRPGAQMIHNLSQTKRIKVLKRPEQKGGTWTLRLMA